MGHSAHVTAVEFSKKGNKLLSTGGADLCVFQWQYRFDKDELANENISGGAGGSAANEDDADEFGFSRQEEEEAGDQALAVKPFLGEVKASTPAGYKASRNSA